MTSAVCTLFEGSYHYGVAALANSLHRAGFRGSVYAGHRGPLPPWASDGRACAVEGWTAAVAVRAGDGPQITFLPLSTPHHLTNHKPEFLLRLLDGPARNADALFYVDPDICVTAPWRFFEDWVSCGVAVCEDVNSPLPENHPRRVGWRRYYEARGVALRFRMREYVNGGFIGIHPGHRAFLEGWKDALTLMEDEIGSLAAASVAQGRSYRSTGFAACFDRTDQDALNVAIEASTLPISVIGQEAMAFKPGAALVPHALGVGKPWQRNYVRAALRGELPRTVDKAFWEHAGSPFAAHAPMRVALKRLELMAGSAIGRLTRRA